MEHYGTRSVLGLREMMAAMAAALAHVTIAESYGHLSWQSLSGTIIAFVAVWAFFDWAIGSWVYKRERARQLKEAQRYMYRGCASTHSPGKIRPCRHGDTTALFMTWEARAKLFAAGVKAIQ